jgi:Ca2+-binding RTX toxin-like protein
MAKIVYETALGFRYPHELFEEETLRLRNHSGQLVSLTDRNGAGAEIQGIGLKFSKGDMTAGIITSARIFDENGHLLLTVSHAQVNAEQVSADIAKYGVSAILWTFASGDDRVTGTKVGDALQGDHGKDIIRGLAGNDSLAGYSGNDRLYGGSGNDSLFGSFDKDVLTGGKGKDSFVLFRDYNIDTVTDFEDGKDMILTQKSMYKQIERHQVQNDVVLDFGKGDELILENTRLADITRDDFSFFG